MPTRPVTQPNQVRDVRAVGPAGQGGLGLGVLLDADDIDEVEFGGES